MLLTDVYLFPDISDTQRKNAYQAETRHNRKYVFHHKGHTPHTLRTQTSQLSPFYFGRKLLKLNLQHFTVFKSFKSLQLLSRYKL